MAMWGLGEQALPAGCTAMQAGQVGLGRRLVEEDEPGPVERRLPGLPVDPGLDDVWPVLLGCPDRLFLKDSPMSRSV